MDMSFGPDLKFNTTEIVINKKINDMLKFAAEPLERRLLWSSRSFWKTAGSA